MGRTYIEGFLSEGIDRETALRIHLGNNHYPPVPASMIEPCSQAIEAGLEEDWNRLIDLPGGVTWRGKPAAPACAIVEGHHLETFLEYADIDSTEEEW